MKFSHFTKNSELSFHSPITQEEWGRITDDELERTEEITFQTPSRKEVPFRKVKHGVWIYDPDGIDWGIGCWKCSICNARNENIHEENKFSANPLKWAGSNFCPNCGADMRKRK